MQGRTFSFPRVLLALAAALLAGAAPATAQDPTDLSLSEAVALALARHPSAEAARATVAAADARVGQARGAYLPSLSVGAALTQFQEPMVVAPLHRFDPQHPPAFDETLYQGRLALEYGLFDGGARGARVRRTEAALRAAEWGRESADMALMARAASVYLRVLSARETGAAHHRRREALSAERQRVELLFEAGRAPRVAVLRARAAESAALAEATRADAEREAVEEELLRVTVMPPGTALGRLEPIRADLPAEPVTHVGEVETSPLVRRARMEAEAALAAADEARAVLLPRVDLDARYLGFGATGVDPTAEWTAGVQVAYPLFTGGARREAVALARAEVEAARARARAAELDVADELARANTGIAAAAAQVDALRDAVRQMEEVVRIERLALDAGAGIQTDYLAAEAELLRLRAALVEARHALAAAHIRSAATAGTLSPAWLAQNLEEP